MLTKDGKRARTLSIKELNEEVMLRVLQSAQFILRQAGHVNVAIDGTRLGGKDVNFVAVGGRAGAKYRISWAPVMVLAPGTGGLRMFSLIERGPSVGPLVAQCREHSRPGHRGRLSGGWCARRSEASSEVLGFSDFGF